MDSARGLLRGKWEIAVVAAVVYIVLTLAVSFLFYQARSMAGHPWFFSIVTGLIEAGILAPFVVGITRFYLFLTQGENVKVELIFSGFHHLVSAFAAYVLMFIYIILWSLLLLVPGIIAAYRYSMVFFILADNPEMSGVDALRKSAEMMKGRKAKLFYLHCRFVGWAFLCFFTFGIGYFWFFPYFQVSNSLFYLEAKGEGELPKLESTSV